jgi:hypothetical protein
LNRVNQDASLQQHQFKVGVQLSVPASGADRLQLVNARVLKDDDPNPRAQRQLVASSGPTDLVIRLTLAELMGREGQPPSLGLEYDSLYTSGQLSLPQRVAVDPQQGGSLILPVLIETPTSRYTVTSDGVAQPETDRAGALKLIDQLRKDHKNWNVYAAEPAPADTSGPSGPSGTGGTSQPVPEVAVMTDLVAGLFSSGSLTKVFVELKADADDAPSSTLVFDPQHTGGQKWHPATGTIPPFRYKITYLFASGKTAQTQGTVSDLVLLLDTRVPT